MEIIGKGKIDTTYKDTIETIYKLECDVSKNDIFSILEFYGADSISQIRIFNEEEYNDKFCVIAPDMQQLYDFFNNHKNILDNYYIGYVGYVLKETGAHIFIDLSYSHVTVLQKSSDTHNYDNYIASLEEMLKKKHKAM